MSKLIGFSEENNRRDLRRPMKDARIVIGGEAYDLIDLSIRGFLCSGYDEQVLHGDQLTVGSIIVDDDGPIDLAADASVIRFSHARQYMAAVFTDISNRTFSMLEKVTMGRPVPENQRRIL
ncbi:MAG TPA: hypothetical protein ENI55_05305 [Alphaproteobacteria bacterium]|nr:hypothetical protein [Alphaproteobacteria bacterium]